MGSHVFVWFKMMLIIYISLILLIKDTESKRDVNCEKENFKRLVQGTVHSSNLPTDAKFSGKKVAILKKAEKKRKYSIRNRIHRKQKNKKKLGSDGKAKIKKMLKTITKLRNAAKKRLH